ncbi:amidase [Spirochaeta dissipatitropha]
MEGIQALGISGLQQLMSKGDLSSSEAVQAYLKRIEHIDPYIHSVIELNPDAGDIAAQLDAERAAGNLRGPLHGIPILLKDNIDTGDRMQTTAGSRALLGTAAEKDAFIAGLLRQNGAVLLGKTNLSEWANFRSTNSSSGWSSRGGQTRNPYCLERSPGGSSSGSAAAVAAGLCAAAVGTETDGSIINPAQSNGLVGMKPTHGLVSREGIIPISRSQDTAGPIAMSVRDAALLLAGMSSAGTALACAIDAMEECFLKGKRIGIARGLIKQSNRGMDGLFERAVSVLRDAGAVLIDVEIPHADSFQDDEFTVLLYEFKAGVNEYLAERGQTLEDVIRFNLEQSESCMPHFGQELLEMSVKKGSLTDARYRKALARSRKAAGDKGLSRVFSKHHLDAIFTLSGGPAWMIDHVNGDSAAWDCSCTSGPAVAGWPHITVPAGLVKGLPVGVSFISRPYEDAGLLCLAHAFEEISGFREAPSLNF